MDKYNILAESVPRFIDLFDSLKGLQGQVYKGDTEDYFLIFFFNKIPFQRLSREQIWQRIKKKFLLRTTDSLKDGI